MACSTQSFLLSSTTVHNRFTSQHHYSGRAIFTWPSRKKNAGAVCCCINGNASSSHLVATAVEEDFKVFPSNKKIHEKFEKTKLLAYEQRRDLIANGEGIGITRYLTGKNFLITGATGFLAKVLIEKILRISPDVGKLYVIIKAKDKEAAIRRLQNEIVETELFRSLQDAHGKNYQKIILDKIIPVVGDIREANIGINTDEAEAVAEDVDVIINSAATTTFDERYDVALDINTIGPFRLMSFAKRFKRLKLFLQVSTAYVNGQRQGIISEKPFCLGDTITAEMESSTSSSQRSLMLDIEAEIKLAFDCRRDYRNEDGKQELKDIGLARAKFHGWQDTYVFTKAMGEMVINCMRGDVPVVTIRPSVIESTLKEPFPGWMEGNRMMDPIVLYYGKGLLTSFLADPNGVLDVVPADMVANAMLAAMAKHGSSGQPGMHIYHVTSSTVNPLVFGDLREFLYEHFTGSPILDPKGNPILVPPMELFSNMDDFSKRILMESEERSTHTTSATGAHEKLPRRLRTVRMKFAQQAQYLASIYEPYTFYKGRLNNINAERLIDEMSDEEKGTFDFNVRSINWKEYITKIHIPGLRKHVMKGRSASSSALLATPGPV